MKTANALIITHDGSDELICALRNILSAEPDISLRIEQIGAREREAGPHADCFEKTQIEQIDIVVIVASRPQIIRYGSIVSCIKSRKPDMPIMAVIDDSTPDVITELLRLGAADFVTPPVRPADVLPRMRRLVEHAQKKRTLIERLKGTIGLKQIIGDSPEITAEIRKISVMAGCDASVLITGETGTGKEMFGRAIHYLGARAGKPFVPVNCGAIPVGLIENELFGHVRGAFTSAATSHEGLIREADGGTLFLDEIDCLPPSAQVKLLRFLQEREYRQLGSAKARRADVRVIAATNSELEQAVQENAFRRDLFYRLNILPLALPPLRARRGDISLLTRHFVDRYALEFNKEIDCISQEAVRQLLAYDWPGNVRELQNVIERAVVFSSCRVLGTDDIVLPRKSAGPPAESFRQAKERVVVEFEKKYIHGLLIAHHGNITHAAKTAGKNRRAFWELMRKHEIDIEQFRLQESKTGHSDAQL